MNIEQNFCNYQISKDLKELGFDEPCFANYSTPTKFNISFEKEIKKFWISAPLLQQALCFLREKYNIHIWIESIRFIHQWTYSYTLEYIIDEYPKANYPDNTFDTYNEALIKALQEAILLVKNK